MPNAVRSRAATGDRSPGIVDTSAIFASHFYFESAASLKFGGTNEYVNGPKMDNLGLTFTNQLTVGLWVKWDEGDVPDAWQGVANATTSWLGLDDGWGIYWSGANDLNFFINNFNANRAIDGNISDVYAWNFVVGVYDGTLGSENVKIYVNGVVGSITDDYTANITAQDTSNVQLGQTANDMSSAGADWTIGNLDEFGIWNTALSIEEITALYNSGSPINMAINSGNYMAAENLALWWRCGEVGDSNTSNGITDRSPVGNSNPGTMINMEDEDIDTVDFAGA